MWILKRDGDKIRRKKRIGLLCAIALPLAFIPAFFYSFAPGWMLRGINDITKYSVIFVAGQEFVQASAGHYFVGLGESFQHELNLQQAYELRNLLRNSWYSRRHPGGPHFFPPDWSGHYEFWITITNERPTVINLNTLSGNLTRFGEESDDIFRIHNSQWEEELFRILDITR